MRSSAVLRLFPVSDGSVVNNISNIYDGAFCENSKRLKLTHYSPVGNGKSFIDVWWGKSVGGSYTVILLFLQKFYQTTSWLVNCEEYLRHYHDGSRTLVYVKNFKISNSYLCLPYQSSL